MNAARNESMDNERLLRVFERWWPDLEERLKAVPAQAGATGPRRDDRAILEEILQLVRADKSPPQRQQAAEPGTPKSMVWKTVHEVSQTDMEVMTIKELVAYTDAVSRRYMETTSPGEEYALDRKEEQALAELARRGHTLTTARDLIKSELPQNTQS